MRRTVIDLKPDGNHAPSGPAVCRRCKKAPPEDGVGTCDSCRQYERVKAALWRADAREICRCLVCKEPLDGSTHKYRGKIVPSRYCAKHAAYYRGRKKAANP